MPQQALRRFDLKDWAAEDVANPYPVYHRYREHDPVHCSSVAAGAAGIWYVFRCDDVASVLSNQHFGRSARVAHAGDCPAPALVPVNHDNLQRMVESWLVFMDPPRHTELRALLSREFSPRIVARLRARIAEIARDLITDMSKRSTVDLVDDFAAPFPILVISELLGVPKEHQVWFRERAVCLQEASTARVGRRADAYARAETAAGELTDYFREEAQRRRGEDHDDLIALLVRAQGRGEPLTDTEIVGTCVHLLTAGHETTTNLISKSVLALLRNPDVLDELRASPDLMPNAVEELVRYDSPVQMVTRWAYRDEVLRGRTIRRGDKVMLVLGSANRDPDRFADPDVLHIRRSANQHCGFGIGIHYCLGATLARVEAEIGLAMLLEKLPELGLTDEPVQYAEDMVFHGPTRLVLCTGNKFMLDE
ncbi:MAG: cytochrome P450 [Egibacteraceae bacterium]